MKACPKCGGTSGWTAHDYFSGWAECLGNWEGTDTEYPQFADTVQPKRVSKSVICEDCGRRIKNVRGGQMNDGKH